MASLQKRLLDEQANPIITATKPLWATHDLKNSDGRVMVRAGTKIERLPADARELLRTGDWTSEEPASAATARVEAEVEAAAKRTIADLPGVSRKLAGMLEDAGYSTPADVAMMTADDLARIASIGVRLAQKVIDGALAEAGGTTRIA